jgi:hypothetical protein
MISILEFLNNIKDGIERSKKNFSQRIKTLDNINNHERSLSEHILKIVLFGKNPTLVKQLNNITEIIYLTSITYKKRLEYKEYFKYLAPVFIIDPENTDYRNRLKNTLKIYINKYSKQKYPSKYDLKDLSDSFIISKIIDKVNKFYKSFILDLTKSHYSAENIDSYIDNYLVGED